MERDFEQFVGERGARLLRAAWLLTGDRHHAEDLLQTALAKCYGRFDALQDDARFESYVRTTLHRTYISWWRKLSWRNEKPARVAVDGEHRDGDADLALDLERALAGLTRPQRAAITLRYVEDLSVAEVARALRLPEGTVKTHIHRGVAALRRSEHLEMGE